MTTAFLMSVNSADVDPESRLTVSVTAALWAAQCGNVETLEHIAHEIVSNLTASVHRSKHRQQWLHWLVIMSDALAAHCCADIHVRMTLAFRDEDLMHAQIPPFYPCTLLLGMQVALDEANLWSEVEDVERISCQPLHESLIDIRLLLRQGALLIRSA